VRKPTTTPLSLLILGDPIVPLNAEEHIVSRFKSGIKREAFYFRGGKRVGVRRWWNDGTLAHEWATDGNDHHGRWVHFHTNGVPDLEASYRNGKRHGIRVQFDRDGWAIGTSEFRGGDGVDLWFHRPPSGPPALGEEWTYQNDFLHGPERWWTRRRVHRENFWFNGRQQGIVREWTIRGRLRRGMPQFWINGKQIAKADYLKARKSDLTLPRYSARDNSASRSFPAELVSKAKQRLRRIRQRIKTLPIVKEVVVATPKEQVFESLRNLKPFSNLNEREPTKIHEHIYGRIEQSTPSFLCIEWIDDRWKSERLSRAIFHVERSNAEGTRSILEFSHVGLPLSSKRETDRFWLDEVFQKVFRRVSPALPIREMPLVLSFDDDQPSH
jgi:hypothetical protein